MNMSSFGEKLNHISKNATTLWTCSTETFGVLVLPDRKYSLKHISDDYI